MNKITLDANPADAPGCIKLVHSDGRDLLIQTDFDWPSIASTFGWHRVRVQAPGYGYSSEYYRPACKHSFSDGTVDCPDCGVTDSQFLQAARQWIEDNDGAQVEDPGYFPEKELTR